MTDNSNPLINFMRQPKIYIRLPSNGMYWPPGSIDFPENQELPVYSMTAKDELTFKTPDALLNGQAVVDVIESCLPNIKDAWQTPNIDLDTILIAIRLASYGELMEITHTVPNTNEEVSHDVDLRILLDKINDSPKWEEAVEINNFVTCFIRPLTYKHLTTTSLKTFEAQRLLQAATNDNLTEEQRQTIYNQSIQIMSEVAINLLVDSVKSIQIPNALVKEREYIKEFLENADREIYEKIENHVTRMRDINSIQPLELHATEEQIAAGAPPVYKIPITMDNSNFFGRGS